MKIWECFDGLPAQQWTYTDDFHIVLENTGLSPGHLLAAFVIKQHNIDFCLDLTNGDLSNSNQLQIWTCNKGNNNQIWLDGPPGGSTPPPPPPPPAGRPLHHNGDTSKCVDVKGAVFANGTPVEM